MVLWGCSVYSFGKHFLGINEVEDQFQALGCGSEPERPCPHRLWGWRLTVNREMSGPPDYHALNQTAGSERVFMDIQGKMQRSG